MSDKAKKAETNDDFTERMFNAMNDGYITMLLSMGSILGLFEVMVTFKEPWTIEEFAKKAGYRERYVREWLAGLVCGDVVEMCEDGKRFTLPAHRHEALTGMHQGNAAHQSTFLPVCGSGIYNVARCFKLDGPSGTEVEEYRGAREFFDVNMKMRGEAYMKRFFGKAPGLTEKLEAGIEVLEIGGSTGHTAFQLAKMFPKSQIFSSDICEQSTAAGERKAREQRFDNLCFKTVDAQAMPSDWTNRFDLVISFEVYHDLPRADHALKETYRVLKSGGAFLLNEISCHSSLAQNVHTPHMPMMYACSILYCMPVAMTVPDSMALGTVWGQEHTMAMLKEAGFKNPRIVDEAAIDYLCIKE